jgi:predicted hotdog family 3-hydroxylacyl-ACP dehydratase
VVYPALHTILPHRPPMILIDELLEYSEHEVVCGVTVREGAPFVAGGRVPALISIEYFAQAVAAFFGYRARNSPEQFAMGMLLGARELDLRADYFTVGDVLRIAGTLTWSSGELAQFSCELLRGEEVLARAAINVLQTAAGPGPAPSPPRD